MKLKVIKDHQDDRTFWIYNPLGGRGRWCTVGFDGVLNDTENSMFLECSPECYQKAYKTFISDRPKGVKNGNNTKQTKKTMGF